MKRENGKVFFYQWELNQRLIVEEDCTMVLFSNGTRENALPVQVETENGKRYANVPNVLLQVAADLHAYTWDDETTTVGDHFVFAVEPMAKPEKYVYTETEVQGITTVVEKALEAAKKSGAFKGEKGEKGETGATGPQGPQGEKGAKGDPGGTPYIGDNGNWWVGNADTGYSASSSVAIVELIENADGSLSASHPSYEIYGYLNSKKYSQFFLNWHETLLPLVKATEDAALFEIQNESGDRRYVLEITIDKNGNVSGTEKTINTGGGTVIDDTATWLDKAWSSEKTFWEINALKSTLTAQIDSVGGEIEGVSQSVGRNSQKIDEMQGRYEERLDNHETQLGNHEDQLSVINAHLNDMDGMDRAFYVTVTENDDGTLSADAAASEIHAFCHDGHDNRCQIYLRYHDEVIPISHTYCSGTNGAGDSIHTAVFTTIKNKDNGLSVRHITLKTHEPVTITEQAVDSAIRVSTEYVEGSLKADHTPSEIYERIESGDACFVCMVHQGKIYQLIESTTESAKFEKIEYEIRERKLYWATFTIDVDGEITRDEQTISFQEESVSLDTTLTKEGKAADAKVVGERLGDIESALDELHNYAQALIGGSAV